MSAARFLSSRPSKNAHVIWIGFSGEFEEALQCRRPWIEGCHPGFDACDVAETARQCLQQLLLFL
jgi:hypothetical protein